jgi:polysaccharide biosynthesis protein VpsQ
MKLTQRSTLLVTIAFGLFLFAIIILANTGVLHEPLSFMHAIPFSDAVGHFILMGAMALLVNLCLRARRLKLGPVGILLGSIIVAIVVTAEEFSQIFLEHRTFSWLDLGADYLGIFILGRVSLILVRTKQSEETADPPDEEPSAD